MGRHGPAEILRESEKLSSTAWENVVVFSHSPALYSIVTVLPLLRIVFLKGFAVVCTRRINKISEYLVMRFLEHIVKVFYVFFFWKSFFEQLYK